MPSPDSLIERFNAVNAALAAPSAALLAALLDGSAATHARFMNTLSLLEHLGSYKIMATQHGRHMDRATLRHLADETRHAFFFKRQAERAAQRPLSYEARDLLAPAAAGMYFQRLEATVKRAPAAQRHRLAVYLYTSLIIEFRAIWFYERYAAAAAERRMPLALDTLLAEEAGHLTDMVRRLERANAYDDQALAGLLAAEQGLYARLLAAWRRSAGPEAIVPAPAASSVHVAQRI